MGPTAYTQAPPLQVTHWFNTPGPLDLQQLRGRVVVIEAFQMLCPGCVSHALPQAQRIHAQFAQHGVAVIGLHSVFEHHAAMPPHALEAFLHEYRIDFPVAVDAASDDGPVPRTMKRYGMRGTPTLVLVDRAGQIRLQHFGRLDDLRVGVEVMALVAETTVDADTPDPGPDAHGCDTSGCRIE